MTTVADAIREVALAMEQAISAGERSQIIDADDFIETLLSIADRLDPPVPSALEGESELRAAARALLEAREEQMITSAEWDRLRNAVAAHPR